AARLGKIEKRVGHHGADRVAPNVLLSSVAAPVPIKPSHGGYGANIERLAKHVAGCAAPTASIATVVPQHCRLLLASPLPSRVMRAHALRKQGLQLRGRRRMTIAFSG